MSYHRASIHSSAEPPTNSSPNALEAYTDQDYFSTPSDGPNRTPVPTHSRVPRTNSRTSASADSGTQPKPKFESFTSSVKKQLRNLKGPFKKKNQVTSEQVDERDELRTASCLPTTSADDITPARIVPSTPEQALRIKPDMGGITNGHTPHSEERVALATPRSSRLPVRRLRQSMGPTNSERTGLAQFKMKGSSMKLAVEHKIALATPLSEDHVPGQARREIEYTMKSPSIAEDDASGIGTEGSRQVVGIEVNYVQAGSSLGSESQPERNEAGLADRCIPSDDMQVEIGEDETSIQEVTPQPRSPKQNNKDAGMVASMLRMTKRTQELMLAAVAAQRTTAVLSEEEIARIDESEKKPSKPTTFQSAKERRLERHKKLHDDGAPLAPKSMREKVAQKFARIEPQRSKLRDRGDQPQSQQAQMHRMPVQQCHAQVRGHHQSQYQYNRKYHSMGKMGIGPHSQKHTGPSVSCHPKKQPRPQQYDKPMPHGKFAYTNSCTSQQYQSQSLPRNAYPPGPGFDQHLQYLDMTWTAPHGYYPPVFYGPPPLLSIPQLPPWPAQNFQNPPMMPYTGDCMVGWNWQTSEYAQQYSQPPPAIPSHLPPHPLDSSQASSAHEHAQVHQEVETSQSSPIGHIDSTGLWRPYQNRVITKTASEGSPPPQAKLGAGSTFETGEMKECREPVGDGSQEERCEKK